MLFNAVDNFMNFLMNKIFDDSAFADMWTDEEEYIQDIVLGGGSDDTPSYLYNNHIYIKTEQGRI